MAKTIKFNLICDDKPIRTIEDLQNNFSVEDILGYYNNKLLHRWLEVRGYSSELEKVAAISSKDSIEIVKELIRIFDISSDINKIEEKIYMFKYLKERKELFKKYNKDNFKMQSIIDDYKSSYKHLVQGILDHPNDIAIIKANISEITTNFKWILELDYRNLFYVLKDKSFLALMCLLMNKESRKYYIPIEIETKESGIVLDIDLDSDKSKMFKIICTIICSIEFKTQLGKNLHVFAGETDGYWKDLEEKGKKYMIISMGYGDFVREAGLSGGDLSSNDVKNKFVIIDGIDYKSNSSTRELLYMEV